MEIRKAKMVVGKGGSGSSTFRATLPATWVRQMGLGEEKRNIKLTFKNNEITIENNEEETEMLNQILEDAKSKIQNEMNKVGYIDDTDMADRFVDNLARGYEDKYELNFDDILEVLDDYMKATYKRKGSCNEKGHYAGCYYRNKEGLKRWETLS